MRSSRSSGVAGMSSSRPSTERDCVDEMHRVLDVGPSIAAPLAADTHVTRRWRHGEIHDRTAAMTHHVAMTYYGAAQRIEWRDGSRRQAALTRPGTITVIPAGHDARWDVHGPIEVSHVYISRPRLAACARALEVSAGHELLDRVGFADAVASRLLEVLALQADTAEPPPRLMQEQAMDLLCMHLVRAGSTAPAPRVAPAARGLAPWQVKRITDYLTAHLGDDVGLDSLAELVGLSRFHLCTAFRIATGLAPHQWLVQRRMTEARMLLRDTSRSITDIGLAVGYRSTSAFSAAFRKATGGTPLQFRRRR